MVQTDSLMAKSTLKGTDEPKEVMFVNHLSAILAFDWYLFFILYLLINPFLYMCLYVSMCQK